MRTILSKSGVMSAERAAQLDDVARREAEKDLAILRRKRRTGSNVFPKYVRADLDDVEFIRQNFPLALAAYSRVAVELRALLEKPGILIMRGNNGPGKTHLASALVNGFCDEGREAYYCTALDFYRQLKSTFGAPGKTAEELIRRFRRFDLLVVDEIEVRSDSKWENDELRSLIDARYASMKATIIITNKSEDEVQTYFTPAIRDRICESGCVLNCDWPSLRQKDQV